MNKELYALSFHQPYAPPQHSVQKLTAEEAQLWANAFDAFFYNLTPPRKALRVSPLIEDPDGEISYLGRTYRCGQPLQPKRVRGE